MRDMDSFIEKTIRSLKKNKIEAEFYPDSAKAVEAVLTEIGPKKSVGIGGSFTVSSLKLPEKLMERGNEVYFHWLGKTPEEMNEARKKASNADIYLSSTNALTENGELVNIDGTGNRVTSMIYGHEKVLVICGRNKIVKDLNTAMGFVKQNTYKNARRLKLTTPCAVTGKCNDCDSPQRMCRVTTIIERQPTGANIKVIIVDEELGF